MDAFRQNWGLRIKTEPLVNTYLNYDKYKTVHERPRPPAQDERKQDELESMGDELESMGDELESMSDELESMMEQEAYNAFVNDLPDRSDNNLVYNDFLWTSPEATPNPPRPGQMSFDLPGEMEEVENDWEDEYENLINEYGQDGFMDIMNDTRTRVPPHLSKRTNKERPYMPNSAPRSLYSLRTVKRIL